MLRLLIVSTVLIVGEASAQPRWRHCATLMIAIGPDLGKILNKIVSISEVLLMGAFDYQVRSLLGILGELYVPG